jgi:hypothetical protein
MNTFTQSTLSSALHLAPSFSGGMPYIQSISITIKTTNNNNTTLKQPTITISTIKTTTTNNTTHLCCDEEEGAQWG